ncbi:MAG: hypothetical protein KDE26_20255 [Bacteroidetes bacterium]|nr:hypothetical protein [Bacteroidota bacterium]
MIFTKEIALILRPSRFLKPGRSVKIIIGGIFLIPLFVSCSSSSKKKEHPLKAQVISQFKLVEETQEITFRKSVTDLGSENPVLEDSLFYSNLSEVLQRETSYAYEYYYLDPLSQEYLEVSRQNDTIIARLSPENDKKLELKEQKILWDADQKNILFLYSHVLKKNWLYQLEVDIAIQFDSNGQYQEHQMKLSNAVPLIGSGIEAMVTGKLVYP